MPKRLASIFFGAALAGIVALPAHAQTMSFAEAAARFVDACERDINSFCKGVNLGGGKLGACLTKNKDSVSARCRDEFPEILAGIAKRAAARTNVLKACDTDRRRLCGDVVKGDGQILDCMLTASRAVSARCNQAITDAGYR